MSHADTSDHVNEELLGEVLMLLDDEAPDGLLRACDLFRAAIPQRLGDIEVALDQGHFDDAARASHSLRGSAGAFGARRLSSLGEQLEALCVQSQAAPATSILGEMRYEWELFRAILDDRLAGAQAQRAAG
jgi:HPt (histidine-containing phosphotransfer) domain-containing protein